MFGSKNGRGYCFKLPKIGILTWHYYHNVGSMLQAYALKTAIHKLGYKAKIINYQNKSLGSTISQTLRQLLYCKLYKTTKISALKKRYSPFILFQCEELETLLPFSNINSILGKISTHVDIVVYGSDQIWAPNAYNSVYFGYGVNKKKVAYAASIGLSRIPNELVHQYDEYLRRFSAISVREKKGQDLLSEIGISSVVVLDPTLLLSCAEYDKIISEPSMKINGDYIFCYFLSDNNEYYTRVNELLHSISCDKVVVLGECPRFDERFISLVDVGPKEFLWLVKNAICVFTDSYHGTIFSLQFHKPFVTFERFVKGDTNNQNSRIEQLRNTFDLRNQIVSPHTVLSAMPVVDYEEFENKLGRLRESSLEYLRKEL